MKRGTAQAARRRPRLRAGGGGARALEWVLDGMIDDDPTVGRETLAGLIETFRQAGLSEERQETARLAWRSRTTSV
jgi:hypothetical protein